MGKASRANKVLFKLADREIAWQRSLLPQAQALKTKFLEKYGVHELALHHLHRAIDNAYNESFEKGMLYTLAIRLIKHTEPKHESHVIAKNKLTFKRQPKRKTK